MACRVDPTPGGGLRLEVEPRPAYEGVVVGESIAVDGVCLTVVAAAPRLVFDVVPETLRRTALGAKAPGSPVNLERALRMGDPLGGHWVQGHVEGVGTVRAAKAVGDDVRLVIGVPPHLEGAFLPKGSVAVDGVSLTVGEVTRASGEERFVVHLIPHTLLATSLGSLPVGAPVNLEPDVLGRWVAHHLGRLGLDPGARGTDGGRRSLPEGEP
jgi:riboflavin synthase